MKGFAVSNKDEVLNTLWLAFQFAFMLFLFAPMEFYLSQKAYFFFGGGDILPFASILTLVAFGAISAVGIAFLAVNKKFYNVVYTILSALSITLYVQGNFIVGDYGALDGSDIDWTLYKTQGIISVSAFVGIFVLFILLAVFLKENKYQKLIRVLCICLVLVQLVTLSTLIITKDGLKKDMQYVSTTEGMYDLSTEKNVIVLMLDTLDSQAMTEILGDSNAETYREILKDFTFYPDTLGTFSWTEMAMPSILSGYCYDNSKTYGEYLDFAYSNSKMFNKMDEDEWKYRLYTCNIFPPSEIALRIDNCRLVEKTVSSHRHLAEYMYKLVAFRYLPQPLKKDFVFYSEDIRADLEDIVGNECELYADGNLLFYNNISNFVANSSIGKAFSMYHLEGTHPPFYVTPELTETDQETSLEDEVRGMMVLIDAFLTKLKEIGVYDNSVIYIMADHGYLDYRQCPLLMIKGINEAHEFEIGTEALSYMQIQDMFLESITSDGTASEIVKSSDKSGQERIYNYCKWSKNMEMTSYAKDIIKYEVPANVKAWDSNMMRSTGEVLSHEEE